MKFYIDTANVDEIRKANDMGIIAGVTTNPSLIAKEGRDYAETLKEIATIVDGPISGEVKATTTDAEGMIAERHHIRPGIKDVLCLTRQHAVPGGVLAVDDDKIRAGIALYPAQQRMQRVKAGLADDIADG